MTITWTNGDDEMPPDNQYVIICSKVTGKVRKITSTQLRFLHALRSDNRTTKFTTFTTVK